MNLSTFTTLSCGTCCIGFVLILVGALLRCTTSRAPDRHAAADVGWRTGMVAATDPEWRSDDGRAAGRLAAARRSLPMQQAVQRQPGVQLPIQRAVQRQPGVQLPMQQAHVQRQPGVQLPTQQAHVQHSRSSGPSSGSPAFNCRSSRPSSGSRAFNCRCSRTMSSGSRAFNSRSSSQQPGVQLPIQQAHVQHSRSSRPSSGSPAFNCRCSRPTSSGSPAFNCRRSRPTSSTADPAASSQQPGVQLPTQQAHVQHSRSSSQQPAARRSTADPAGPRPAQPIQQAVQRQPGVQLPMQQAHVQHSRCSRPSSGPTSSGSPAFNCRCSRPSSGSRAFNCRCSRTMSSGSRAFNSRSSSQQPGVQLPMQQAHVQHSRSSRPTSSSSRASNCRCSRPSSGSRASSSGSADPPSRLTHDDHSSPALRRAGRSQDSPQRSAAAGCTSPCDHCAPVRRS